MAETGTVVEPEPIEQAEALQGSNLAGNNLAGTNLAGNNLAGTNLAGFNLGGNNLAGTNLAGANLAGTNLGGNNLAGTNLAGSNLAGTNLAGTNLAGTNLAGTNLAGSNLAGSNLAGTNLAGNNLSGSNLSGTNLSGSNSGANIHSLSGSASMLYSREDVWLPKTGQCIVSGIGSTSFAKLLGQQSANATISVALGKLPWGFASTSGGAKTLDAWEAVVWGDKTYCVFVLAAPTTTVWTGVAGFLKSIFRWQAPPTQTMNISGIEASAAYDPSVATTTTSYTGMMNTAALYRAGTILDTNLVAGELAFLTATTNNISVMVDFSSWMYDKNKNPVVLGNVQSSGPPNYAEAVYSVVDNGDGTVAILVSDAAAVGGTSPGIIDSSNDLDGAYRGYQQGRNKKPIPRRCSGALYLNAKFGETMEVGKCDSGLVWGSSTCGGGSQPWSNIAGTTAPMSSYMRLTNNGGAYTISANGTCNNKPVISQTYIHLWTPTYDIPFAFAEGENASNSFAGTAVATACPTCSAGSKAGALGNSSSSSVTVNNLNVATTGNYTLTVNAMTYATRQLYISVNGGTDKVMTVTTPDYIPVPNNLTVALQAGNNTIRFRNTTAWAPDVDNVAIYPASGYTSLASGTGATPTAGQIYKLTTSSGCIDQANASTQTGALFTFAGCSGSPTQAFKLNSLAAGKYSLINQNSGLCLDVPNGSTSSGTALDQATCTGGNNQAFTLLASGSGYTIRSVASSLCVATSGTSAGTSIQQATCNGSNQQAWLFQVQTGSGGGSCTAETNTAFCSRLGKNCGSVTASDNCGTSRTVSACGTCTSPQTCGGGGTSNVCGGGSSSTCKTSYAHANCLAFLQGIQVSWGGHNWTCSNGNCMNCDGYATCAPGGTGCPWGVVWTDNGTCN